MLTHGVRDIIVLNVKPKIISLRHLGVYKGGASGVKKGVLLRDTRTGPRKDPREGLGNANNFLHLSL